MMIRFALQLQLFSLLLFKGDRIQKPVRRRSNGIKIGTLSTNAQLKKLFQFGSPKNKSKSIIKAG